MARYTRFIKKIQRHEDDDLRLYGRNKGWTEEEIEICIRNTHLYNEIWRYKGLLYEDDKIMNLLLKSGWKNDEIQKAMKVISRGTFI